ncbi:MAG: TolC family protein [Pirellulaceae bacterium]|nr:TolC family protein [Pirellulaceae bacterium]
MRVTTPIFLLAISLAAISFAQEPSARFDSMQMRTSDVSLAPGFQNSGLALDALQSMALANNPTLRQAKAQVDAAQGAALQAGLPPNPHVGFVAEQIGVNGTAGELLGGSASQEFVRGDKLGLSRAKYCQRVQIAMTNLQAQEQRVRNDIEIRFYQALAAQRMIEVAEQTIATANDNVLTHREMLNMGQLGEAEVLQAEVALRRASVNRRQAYNDIDQARRELMAFVGVPDSPNTGLIGTLDTDLGPVEWDTALSQLLASSPEVVAAQQKIRHDEIVIRRELAEPIPNVTAGLTTGYNAETQQAVAGVSIGMPIPIFNRNQGTVRQARADLSRSYAEVERLQLDLQNALAKQFRDYVSAWEQIQEYEQTMLPKSRKAVEILEQSYRDRRAPWTSVLAAKQMLLSLESEQIQNQLSYRMADVSIRGNLLLGGLTEPSGPMTGGHIDANNQPR